MDVSMLHRRAVESWVSRLAAVSEDQWQNPTPCTDWNVRELVNHVVGEERWTVPLLQGRTIEDVGSDLDGDLLGDDPAAAGREAAEGAASVMDEKAPAGGKVALSYGQEDVAEYAYQLAADHLVHGWDLAAATGGDTDLDPELVHEVATWFAEREEIYRSGGAIGPRATSTGGAQADLLASFGRDGDWAR
ncbi:MAG: TIGR03086 family metal-binding protein [Actinomycetes bacterium]